MLEVNNINVFYGAFHAIWDLSLRVEEDETVALIGPNGHGKTTMLKTISGLLRSTTGYIKFDGKDITKSPPHEIVKMGIIHIPQDTRLFPDMTVMENLSLGAYMAGAWRRRYESLERVFGLFPALEERKNQIARSLSGGERRMLAIGRGLMSSAKLLLLDEPSFGLAPILVRDVFKKVEETKKMGISLLLAEQNIKYVSEIAERIYLIEGGKVSLEGGTDEVLSNKYLKEAYLGLR